MRAKHTLHSFPGFPIYSSAFVSSTQLIIGGGGGTSKSGIKNQIRLYSIDEPSNGIELVDQVSLAPGEDAPMSMAASSSEPHPTLVCGVNSPEQDVKQGHNENCRVFGLVNNKFGALATRSTIPGGEANIEDYQKITAISSDSTMLAVASTTSLHLLSYPTLLPIAQVIEHKSELWDVSFSSTELLLATASALFVYSLPESHTADDSPKKNNKKSKRKASNTATLTVKQTIEMPDALGGKGGSVFRAARFNPVDPNTFYTITNTVPARNTKSRKTPPRRGFVSRWTLINNEWKVEKVRKISEKGITAFDISPCGKFLAYGGSDYTVALLDSQTLYPMVQILHAHTLPPTTLTFNPTGTLLVSGSADSSIRIVDVPEHKGGGYSWGVVILILLTVLVLLLALALQKR